MIVDASAVIAIAREEPGAEAFREALAETTSRLISAVTWLEACMVLDGPRDPIIARRFDETIESLDLQIEPVTPEQAKIARQAFRDFGRGSGHPAKLNFGDCLAYALAKDKGEPILFKGNDFSQTDLRSALPVQ